MFIIITILLSALRIHAQSIPNVNITFIESPQPFQINVDATFLDETLLKVRHARRPENIDAFPSTDGPISMNWTLVHNVWLNEYDWGNVQAGINNEFQQFTTIVRPQNSTYNEQIPLHFVHHRSSRADAIPLLWIHGWPGSFLEVSKIIDILTNPPNKTLPAFHVVAPSIPGYGFSPAPVKPGFGPTEAGKAFNALMQQLNYTQYVGQGGDFGSIILRAQSISHPEALVSILSNFWPINPNTTDIARFNAQQTTPDETSYLTMFLGFLENFFGYGFLQSARPLVPAYATTDSPMGLAMWIASLLTIAADPRVLVFTPEEIITWTMMYWIQGPYAGMRFYKEARAEGLITADRLGVNLGYASVPIAVSEFPYDVFYNLPLDWAQRAGDVKRRYVHNLGGHFAAYEVPQALAEDIWDWFGDREVSGTSMFAPR